MDTLTWFRYSVRTTDLNLTAVPDQPGGSVMVEIPAGTASGQSQIYAVASTGTVNSSMTAATFEVLPTTLLAGQVFDAETFLPAEGALVVLQPGNHQTTTAVAGTYMFPLAEYRPGCTRSRRRWAPPVPVRIDLGPDTFFDIYLFFPIRASHSAPRITKADSSGDCAGRATSARRRRVRRW